MRTKVHAKRDRGCTKRPAGQSLKGKGWRISKLKLVHTPSSASPVENSFRPENMAFAKLSLDGIERFSDKPPSKVLPHAQHRQPF